MGTSECVFLCVCGRQSVYSCVCGDVRGCIPECVGTYECVFRWVCGCLRVYIFVCVEASECVLLAEVGWRGGDALECGGVCAYGVVAV